MACSLSGNKHFLIGIEDRGWQTIDVQLDDIPMLVPANFPFQLVKDTPPGLNKLVKVLLYSPHHTSIEERTACLARSKCRRQLGFPLNTRRG